MNLTRHTQILKQTAKKIGFSFCGVSKAQRLDEEEAHLSEWLEKGYHGKMAYMENHKEKIFRPLLNFSKAKNKKLLRSFCKKGRWKRGVWGKTL